MEGMYKKSPFCFNFVLLGESGSLKSAAGNTILGREAFISKKSHKSVTQDVQKECGSVFGIPIAVYDTPGFCDTELSDEQIRQKCQNVLSSCESESEFCWYLLVISADRFTAEERRTVEQIEDLLGEDRLKKTWILFTRGDELEDDNQTKEKLISRTDDLKKLVQKYEDRYHVFNNKMKGSDEEVEKLLIKVLQNFVKLEKHRKRQIITSSSTSSDRRIVLLGKTGFGKSETGNTILGDKRFKSKLSMKSTTRQTEACTEHVEGRNVTVVDTPGFFDTNLDPNEVVTEILRCIYESRSGPHAFLIVLPINGKFTEQEEKIIQQIHLLFGEEVAKYAIIVFTHGDALEEENEEENIEDLIKENESLNNLVQKCGGRYHILNNKDQENREQVRELLEKIDRMVEENGRSCYSNEMFKKAAQLRNEEENQNTLLIPEGNCRKEQREMREGAEGKVIAGSDKPDKGWQTFFKKYYKRILICALAGGIVGGVVGGVVAGPVGIAGALVGAVVGAVGGAVVGAVTGNVGGAVGGAEDGAVGGVVSGAFTDNVGGAVGGAEGGAVTGNVGGAVGGAEGGAVTGNVGGAVGGAEGGAVGGAEGGAVTGNVGGAVGGAKDGAVTGNVGGAVCGVMGGAFLYGNAII